jgi:dTDP-4-dehydrorhamnose 3,5-epimerase-like enzyme
MTNREYTAAVERGQFPEDIVVPIPPPFENDAGQIFNLLLEKITSVAIIESVADSIRSNHYHKTDWHYMYVLSGVMCYYWRPVGSKDPIKMNVFKKGQMMFTPPMVIHATYFPEPTTIITFAKNVRDHETHEADLVRSYLIRKDDDGNVVEI